jgi:hypothetical protein
MSAEMPAILIGGVPRTGKTRLAAGLAALTGFDVIHCDQFRKRFWSIADEQTRSSERLRWYGPAIAERRGGLIIEGDDLVCRNCGDTELAKQGLIRNDRRLSMELMEHLRSTTGARVFVVGGIDAEPESMAAAIRRHETPICFTRALSRERLEAFVRTSIERSRQLKAMAAEARIAYLEMGGEDFEGAIEAAAHRIFHELDQLPVEPALGARR